jgi:putative ABC transport system permease protein
MGNLLKVFYMYNLKTWKRNKMQFFFSMIGIAMGIAVVLAIQLLSSYSTLNLKESSKIVNGGDIGIVPSNAVISDYQLDTLKALQTSGDIDFTNSVWSASNINLRGKSSAIVLRFIDTKKYPLYNSKNNNKLKTNQLKDNAIILSENVAIRIDAKKGDIVKIFNKYTGNNESYTISEIVKDDGETAQDMNVFGYALVNDSNLSKFDEINNACNKIYIRVNDSAKINDITKKLKNVFAYAEIKTSEDVFQEAKDQIETTKNALMIIGILTFVISGIGIANTMLLSVLKRQRELSILKVFGMKNSHLPFYMMAESIVISVFANIIGIPLGIVFSTVIYHVIYGSWIDFSNTTYMIMPINYIVLVSIFVSIVFTFIPASICNKIKTITVLREQYINMGEKLQLTEPILIITVVIGIVFSVLLKSLVGILCSFGLLIFGGLLYMLLGTILKGISRLSNMGNKTILFTFRNMGRQNKRISIVLVTLIIGMTSVGITVNISDGILPSLKKVIQNQLGYNVLITTSLDNSSDVEDKLRSEKDIYSFTKALRTDTSLKYINGQDKELVFEENIQKPLYKDKLNNLLIEGLKFDKQPINCKMRTGRWLNKSDELKNSAVISSELADCMNIRVNDEIGMIIEGKIVKFKVVGIKDKTVVNTSQITTTYGMLNDNVNWNSVVYYVNANNENLQGIVKNLNQKLDKAFVLNIDDLLPSLYRAVNNQIMLFSFVAVFCILASIFLMSNMTLITFLDRMKEFVLLKIMGAKNSNIIRIIILESLIVGFIGGLISVIFTEILTSAFFNLIFKMNYIIKYSTIPELIGLSIIVVCISALLVIPQIKVKQLNILLRSE